MLRRFLAALALVAPLAALTAQAAPRAAAADTGALGRPLPTDSAVTIGTLPNGLRYYIRENRKPERRAELRLVVKAGSVLEGDDQRGLAHLLEHMAFNGTRDYPRNELVSWLERTGMRFGPDVNAYTSFDETVYMLQLPTDSAGVLRRGFAILDDWARFQTLDSAEVEKERGVVIEEWRLGRGAGSRMRDKQLPIVLAGSRYASRLPIGTKESLEGFDRAALTRFYREWYRPDLMAIVAVGDFDRREIERAIREEFGGMPAPAAHARPRFEVPVGDTMRFAVATDREATGSSVAVYFVQPERRDSTVAGYRRDLVAALYNGMLNQRLFELSQSADAPFLGASSSQGRFVGPSEVYILGASVKDGGIPRGLETLLTEAERVRRHGFTPSELERERADLLRGLEQAYAEREKTESSTFASEYAANFLDGDPIPGIAYEYDLARRIAPGITIADVNALAREWIADRGRVVTANLPERDGSVPPAPAELRAVFDRVRGADVAAYADSAPTAPLVPTAPKPGRVVSRSRIPEIGVTRWTLSNGATVILKPTDFRADQVLLRGFSAGGTSLLADAQLAAASSATSVVAWSGLGAFNRIELQKALAGKAASLSPGISGLEEGVSGSASPKDMKTMFELLWLTFTAPRGDSAAVAALKAQQKGLLENMGASPEVAFSDTLVALLTQHHPRTRRPDAARVDSIDARRSLAFYRDRFADASDFTFVIVGSFALDSIEPLVRTYIGGLPSLHRKESWRDVGIRPPRGVVTREVRKGEEPKSRTQLVFTGPFVWTPENRYAIDALAEVLRIRLRETLREGMSGTYGVSVSASPSLRPRPSYQLGIGFGSAPERAADLTRAIFATVDSLKATGATADEIAKVRETQRREEETGLKENGWWLSTLVFAAQYGEDPRTLSNDAPLRSRLTSEMVRDAARRYLDAANYVGVTLLPAAAMP